MSVQAQACSPASCWISGWLGGAFGSIPAITQNTSKHTMAAKSRSSGVDEAPQKVLLMRDVLEHVDDEIGRYQGRSALFGTFGAPLAEVSLPAAPRSPLRPHGAVQDRAVEGQQDH